MLQYSWKSKVKAWNWDVSRKTATFFTSLKRLVKMSQPNRANKNWEKEEYPPPFSKHKPGPEMATVRGKINETSCKNGTFVH